MMERISKRLLSFLLVVIMVVSMIPASVFAADAALVLPTATVTEIVNKDLTFALNFKADEANAEQLAYYGDWYADFVLTVNKAVTFDANGGADGYLSGQYDEWSENWVNVPYNKSVSIAANEPVKIMEFAAELMGKSGLKVTYNDVYTSVKDFDCGVFFEEAFLDANPDLEVTLELRMYNPADESESYVIGDSYIFNIPELPTATVSDISNKELTFAVNFKADEVSAAQLAYYGNWYADFVLTVNKDVTFDANGGADGYLSGQYDEWSENWVDVPYNKAVSISANEPVKIMAFAAELMGKPGLKYTYAEVYESVKDFDCGVFFEKAFLDANPDLEVTLELRMYNPADESENYVIGETYIFSVPELPTATICRTQNEELTFAMNFKADQVTEAQLAYYGDWYADFVLTINKDVTFLADGSADGYLSGQYDGWSENWVDVPYNKSVSIAANEPVKIMAFAAELMGKTGLKYTYAEIYNGVKDFNCGVFFEKAFLDANPDLEVTLELRMYNPADESESYAVGEVYVFTPEKTVIAENTGTGNTYTTVTEALDHAEKGETVRLLENVAEEYLTVAPGRTLDLNGNTLVVESINSAYKGTHIVDASNGEALLKVEARDAMAIRSDNVQLPVWVEEDSGYRFASASFAQKASKVKVNGVTKTQFKFYLKGEQPDYLIARELADGAKDNDGLTFRIKMTCLGNNGTETEYYFTFPANNTEDYGIGWPDKMMFVNIAGLENVKEVKFSAMICFDKTVVTIVGDPVGL